MAAGSDWTCSLSTMHEWESPDYEPSLPVSEKSNPLTRDIDRASANSIVQMLQACDAQMFQEEETGATYQRLLSDQVVETLMEVAKRLELILKDPQDSLVVLSGCGTSGRMAFLITSVFNRALKELNQSSVYSYIIAGGDRALLSSQEAPEDDPKLGMLSLKKVCEGKKRVLFIGISCGLSAPFVAGQLDFCLQHSDVYTPVLVGFNPAHQARDEPMPGCTLTFRSVVQRMQALAKSHKAFLINPAVGPEAISGSSRMKGGSATKILLEVLLSAAHAAAFTNTPITYRGVLQHMKAYEQTLDITYAQSEGMTALLEAAGQSLRRGGRVCYLGWGSLAVLGLVDASECNPTFGADYNDVRGFISGGYRELSNNEGPLISLGPDFCIAHEDFLRLVLPSLTDQDFVLLLYTHSDDVSGVVELARRVREKTSNLHAVYHRVDGDTAAAVQQDDVNNLCSSSLNITWPSPASGSLLRMQWELSTKLLLNAVSTGAHVLKGKIYHNHMIDVQATNSKLYCRATRLLQKLSGCPQSQCEEALLKAIYQVDELTVDITSSDINTHTRTARNRTKREAGVQRLSCHFAWPEFWDERRCFHQEFVYDVAMFAAACGFPWPDVIRAAVIAKGIFPQLDDLNVPKILSLLRDVLCECLPHLTSVHRHEFTQYLADTCITRQRLFHAVVGGAANMSIAQLHLEVQLPPTPCPLAQGTDLHQWVHERHRAELTSKLLQKEEELKVLRAGPRVTLGAVDVPEDEQLDKEGVSALVRAAVKATEDQMRASLTKEASLISDILQLKLQQAALSTGGLQNHSASSAGHIGSHPDSPGKTKTGRRKSGNAA